MEENNNTNSDIEQLKIHFKDRMITEFTKFLKVYNEVANTNYILDIRGEYDVFIRFLGNYIYKHFGKALGFRNTLKI